MAETRDLTTTEARALSIFSSSYRSRVGLRLASAGEPPEPKWSLTHVQLTRPVTRRLDGNSVSELSELYGPTEKLRFIGAFEHMPETVAGAERLAGLLTWRHDEWNESAFLCDIRVRPEFQEQGIGTRLMQDLMWAATQTGARGIMLETQTTNAAAIDFYLARGFKMVGFNSAMYGEPGAQGVDAALFFWFSLEG